MTEAKATLGAGETTADAFDDASTAVFPQKEIEALAEYAGDTKTVDTWFAALTDSIEPRSAVLVTGFMTPSSEMVICSITPKLGGTDDVVNALVATQKSVPQLAEAKTLVVMLDSGCGYPLTYNDLSTAITKQFPGAIFPCNHVLEVGGRQRRWGIVLAHESKHEFVHELQATIHIKLLQFHKQLDKTRKAELVAQLLDFRRVFVKPDYIWHRSAVIKGSKERRDDTMTWSLAMLVSGPPVYRKLLLATVASKA